MDRRKVNLIVSVKDTRKKSPWRWRGTERAPEGSVGAMRYRVAGYGKNPTNLMQCVRIVGGG